MKNLQETKILLVDDSSFSLTLLKQMLSEENISHLFTASDAKTAISLIKEKSPHIVITDIVMPEMSGIELTKMISDNFPDIATIVISSLSQDHIILEAISAGASDFISKPIEKNQLLDAIEKVLTIEK